MELLAAEAREAAGTYDTQRSEVAAWRTELQRSLRYATADSALQALGIRGCSVWDGQAAVKLGAVLAGGAGADFAVEAEELRRQQCDAACMRSAAFSARPGC